MYTLRYTKQRRIGRTSPAYNVTASGAARLGTCSWPSRRSVCASERRLWMIADRLLGKPGPVITIAELDLANHAYAANDAPLRYNTKDSTAQNSGLVAAAKKNSSSSSLLGFGDASLVPGGWTH